MILYLLTITENIINVEKTESRRNSFSNRNEPIEEYKEDQRNQIESPCGGKI